MRPTHLRDDVGSVMVLVVGLVPVLVLVFAVGVDTAVLFSHRRALSATADSAALAAAQAGDLERIYRGSRRLANLPVDCAAARRTATEMVSPTRSDRRAATASVESVRCDGTNVTVSLRSRTSLPFVSRLGLAPDVVVRSQATARSPLR